MRRFVLVWGDSNDGSQSFVAGQLAEPFVAVRDAPTASDVDLAALRPGDEYTGPVNKNHGTYHLRQKHGGVIERKAAAGSDFALLAGTGKPQLEENAARVIAAWRELFTRGITFHINDRDDAWCTEGGERRFLAHVPGGFIWPSSNEGV